MRNKLKSTRTTMICCIIIGVLLVGLSVYAAFSSDQDWRRQSGTPTATAKTPTPTPLVLPEYGDTDAVVLVLETVPEQNRIRVYAPEQDAEYELSYTGTTDIRDRFGAVIAVTQVDVAAIAKVSFDAESGRLYSLQQTQPDWCYEKQSGVELNVEKCILTVAGNNYRFTGNSIVMETGVQIPMSELASVDELTVKGMGDRVFLIERNKGHGELELQNLDAFSGGCFYIDGKKAEDVEGDMRLTIREGDYRFALENGELYAEKVFTIQRETVAQWNLSEYLPKPPEYGRVEFLLEPEGAELYIDNQLQENTAFAELEYGEHVVGLYKNGYVSWTGKITVSSEKMLFSIALVAEPVMTPTPTPTEAPSVELTPTPTEVPSASEQTTPTPVEEPEVGEEEQKDPEDDGTRTVQIVWYPTSVVSVDSVYAGTTDASGVLVAKLQDGTHVVELTRILLDGSTMPKKYTVDVTAQTTVMNFLLTD